MSNKHRGAREEYLCFCCCCLCCCLCCWWWPGQGLELSPKLAVLFSDYCRMYSPTVHSIPLVLCLIEWDFITTRRSDCCLAYPLNTPYFPLTAMAVVRLRHWTGCRSESDRCWIWPSGNWGIIVIHWFCSFALYAFYSVIRRVACSSIQLPPARPVLPCWFWHFNGFLCVGHSISLLSAHTRMERPNGHATHSQANISAMAFSCPFNCFAVRCEVRNEFALKLVFFLCWNWHCNPILCKCCMWSGMLCNGLHWTRLIRQLRSFFFFLFFLLATF